jgi:hypothetical protein
MARRNANGEGTVYRRKDGRYEGAAYLLTTDRTPKRIRVYGKTRAEVHGKLVKAKAKAQQGLPIFTKALKLDCYLDRWLEHLVKPSKRPATYAQCEMITRLYLKPELGTRTLQQLTVPIVQDFLNRMIAGGHSIPKVQVIRKVLSSALTHAMREEGEFRRWKHPLRGVR